jgi:hypothetical protein
MVVVFVFASMVVGALGLVYRYGTRTLPQNDEVWALYDSGPGIHVHWLWKTWAEHRMPLAKLIWKGVLQWTNYDFRAGDFFTVLSLAAVAGLMVWTANRIRGRTILADAFFPLAILNFGQAQTFLWWWEVNHVLAPIVATVLLSVVITCRREPRLDHLVCIGIALILLVLCGPGGLPYVVAFAAWLAILMGTSSSGPRSQYLWVLAPVAAAFGLLIFYFVDYTPYFPVNDPPSIPSWPPAAGLRDSAVAMLQILGVSLGVATKPYAILCGAAVLTLVFATAALLVRRLLLDPADRLRTLGLLLFLGAGAGLVFVIARSRAGMGLDYIYQGHYAVVVMPTMCCIYLAWEIQKGATASVVQYGLLLGLAALFPFNLRAAVQLGEDVQQKMLAFERDVQNSVPVSVLAERHFASDVVPRAEKLAVILKDHKTNGIGIFKDVRDDPPARVEILDPGAAIPDDVVLREGIISSTVDNHAKASLTWKLMNPRHVYAIRIRYAYIRSTNPWPTLRAYWRNSLTQEFNDSRAWFSTVAGPDQPTWALVNGKIQTNARVRTERTLTMWVDATIDQLRIYPDSAPCDVRFSNVELLVPES